MPPPPSEEGALEEARKRLYDPVVGPAPTGPVLSPVPENAVAHAWEDDPIDRVLHDRADVSGRRTRRVRAARYFLLGAFLFAILSFGVAVSISYFGGNTVSVDKVLVTIESPTSVAGGDALSLSITVTNTNAVDLKGAVLTVDFPPGTRSADDTTLPYPRYTDELGALPSGGTVTRSVRAVVFGGNEQGITLPVSVSYGAPGSNATFVKKVNYPLTVSTSPLSVTLETVHQAVPGKSVSLRATVRSNASIPLDHVVVSGDFPFGFSVLSSSIPLVGSSALLGTLAPGETRTLLVTGTLAGQEHEERVFHFSVGTSKGDNDSTLAVTYMTTDATITLVSPFISATLAINGDASQNIVIQPSSLQTVTVSYANALPTAVANATISVTLSGGAVDYESIETRNGFYRSNDHTVVFSRDTDSTLALLAPNSSGIGTFTFSTLPASASGGSPNVTFTVSVSGAQRNASNVLEQINASATKVVKVSTAVTTAAATLHTSGSLASSGPLPPKVGETTTYTMRFSVGTEGTAVAGATMTALLPQYVSYTGVTGGSGSFSYNQGTHMVTWNVGDLAAHANLTGEFQVSLTPSSSQKGTVPTLASRVMFSGFDRFASIPITQSLDPLTTEMPSEPGYVPTSANVQ